MKTIEFKLHLTAEQNQKIDTWLDTLRQVYNRGLALLEWRQHYQRYQKCLVEAPGWDFDLKPVAIRIHKVSEEWALYCDCAAEFRIDRKKGREIEGNLELRPVVNLVKPHWHRPPLIDGASAIALRKPFAKKRYPPIGDIPAVYFNDFIGLVLAPAWEQYQKGVRARPRYKRRHDRVNTISSESFRAQCKLRGKHVKLPGLEWLTIKGLDSRLSQPLAQIAVGMRRAPERYPELIPLLEKGKSLEEAIAHATTPGSFRLCRKASGYYLQISAPLESRPAPASSKGVGVAFGANQLYATSHNRAVPSPQSLQRQLANLQRLQLRLSRCRSPEQRRVLTRKIAKLHEHIVRQRRGFHHWHSTNLVNMYGSLSFSDLEMAGLIDKPDPVIAPKGDHYDPNGAERAARINQAFTDAGIGQFKTMIEQKAKVAGRRVCSVPPEQVKEHLGQSPPTRQMAARTVLALSDFETETAARPPRQSRTKKRQRQKRREAELLPQA